MRHQQEHERQLHALSQDKHKKRLTLAAVGVSFLLIFVGVSAALYINKQHNDAAAQAAEAQRESQELQGKLDALTKQADDAKANQENLQAQLGAATDVATKLALEKQIEEAKKQEAELAKQRARLGAARASSGGGGGGGGPTKPRPACTCQAGDPLCSCIQ